MIRAAGGCHQTIDGQTTRIQDLVRKDASGDLGSGRARNKEVSAHNAGQLEMAVVLDIHIAVQCALQSHIGAGGDDQVITSIQAASSAERSQGL